MKNLNTNKFKKIIALSAIAFLLIVIAAPKLIFAAVPQDPNAPTTVTPTPSTNPAPAPGLNPGTAPGVNPAPAPGVNPTTPGTGTATTTADPCTFDSPLNSTSDTVCNPLKQKTLLEIVINLISQFTAVIGLIAVGVIVFAGFRMVIAAGNEEQIKAAKSTATWAIIGVVVAMLAYSIISIIQNTVQNGNLK